MNKLWIFGDSFSSCFQTHLNKHEENGIWTEHLAEYLNVADIEYRSAYGYSNEYIFKTILDNFLAIKSEDYIIVQLTSPYRRWFIKEDPSYCNYHTITNSPINDYVTPEIKKAIAGYIAHLQNDESDILFYQMMYYSLFTLFETEKKLNFKVLPGFFDIPGVEGTMNQLSDSEFIDDSASKRWHKTYTVDLRQNHLSEVNHPILAKKIYHWFENPNSKLDLIQGFEHGFIK